MTVNDFVKIVLDASQETVQGLKSTTQKLELLLKVVSMVLAEQEVKLDPDGLRDLNAIRIADQVRLNLQALANETYTPPPCAKT